MHGKRHAAGRAVDCADRSPLAAASGSPSGEEPLWQRWKAINYQKYERIAGVYDLIDGPYEILWKRRLRPAVFEDATGTILDAGAGTGCNVQFYPPGHPVTGIDLSPRMLKRARRRAAKLGVDARFMEMDVMNTSFPDASFDTIVATFVFCVLDQHQQLPALKELRRLCRPGGTIRLLDYSMSERPLLRYWMKCVSPWLRWAFAGTYEPGTERYVDAAGLEIVSTRMFMGDAVKLLVLRPRPPQ